jgi:hypothetical protein
MISPMQAMRLLAMSGVTMAAGAMISLSFAVSPPLMLLPPLPVPIDAKGNVASQSDQTAETVGGAIANNFERRWQASDTPLMPPRDPLRGLIGGVLPLTRDAARIAAHDFYIDRGPYHLVRPQPLSIDIMSVSVRYTH